MSELTRPTEFKIAVRGYDRDEVDAYIARLRSELEREQESHSPSGAVKRALEQVGEEVADILKRAHETSAEVTESSRREADERLEGARRAAEERIVEANVRAAALTAEAEARLRELDMDTDRIWAERDRIVADARELARQLIELADAAAERFPPEDAELEDDVEVLDGETLGEAGRNGNGPAPAGPA